MCSVASEMVGGASFRSEKKWERGICNLRQSVGAFRSCRETSRRRSSLSEAGPSA
jgi:hypothetical protein